MARRSILILGGGTAGWLTAAYLARALGAQGAGGIGVTVLESPDIGIIGVGEGTFPTIRNTLRFLGIDEPGFIRATSATFKQGIRFDDWVDTPRPGEPRSFLHPFEAPFQADDVDLVAWWLLQDAEKRPPFAEAVTIQNRVAEAQRAPKRPDEGDFAGPLNYAYHFDAASFARVLADRARALGVRHVQGTLRRAVLGEDGNIARVETAEHGTLTADLYIDCSGFRAELIDGALGSPLRSVRDQLFTNRALACKRPYDRPDAPLASYTIAAAHEAGWVWDIGLAATHGVGCVYSSDHIDDDRAEAILRGYLGIGDDDLETRLIAFDAGYRERQWVGNCVAVGLSAGFLEPLEATGVVMIEAAVAMIAELFPHNGPIDAPARRFNELMAARYVNIVNFLKLHYCLSRRDEPFWRDNGEAGSIPDRLRELLDQWRHRPPCRYDFLLDLESFAFFNYQYILYGMEFRTDLAAVRGDSPDMMKAAERLFARIRGFGERASRDLPSHRALIEQINLSASATAA